MTRTRSIGEIFAHNPEGVNLIGFPTTDTPILLSLEYLLSREPLLKQIEEKGSGKKTVAVSFDPRYIRERQEFFRRVDSPGFRTRFFDTYLKQFRAPSSYQSKEGFLDLCSAVYEIVQRARTDLGGLRGIEEVQKILPKIDSFDSELKRMLELLKSIESGSVFAIDTAGGQVRMLSKMPLEGMVLDTSSFESKTISAVLDRLNRTGILKLKEEAVNIAEELGIGFKRRIFDYVEGELRVRPGEENIRSNIESIAFPLRLNDLYDKFVQACQRYNLNLAREAFGQRELREMGLDECSSEELERAIREEMGGICLMPPQTTPKFGDHYDIRRLFPPKLMSTHFWQMYDEDEGYVPIDFKTTSRERKFLIAGLHSGSKSFFIENLVIASILGQLGVDLFGDSVTLPAYQRIYYYRNTQNTGGVGKLETEIRAINQIARQAKEKDAIFIDEFLDSTGAEIGHVMGKMILRKLRESRATVFVASHKDTDYARLKKEGWIIMSPDYEIEKDRVKPLRRLVRGAPDEGINVRYIEEKYRDLFK
ncbi:MAG: hypothetical protein WC796_03915 [Candidatus Pacearchaeota archaeon]|jgi:hypothetical protein